MIIAIGGQKGGTGKTTTTANFASALAHERHSVGIYEADPEQSSIYYWGLYRRGGSLDLPPVPIYRGEIDEALAAGHDYLLIDLQGANTDKNRFLIRFHADAWLVPYKPTHIDMDNAQTTTLGMIKMLRAERPDIPFNIVINEAPTNSLMPDRAARQYLETEYGDPKIILDTVIRRRQPYIDCMGLGVGVAEMPLFEQSPSVLKARAEFMALYSELADLYNIGSERIISGASGFKRNKSDINGQDRVSI